MNAQLVRSFISVDIEETSLLSKILQLQKYLQGTGADLKLVEPENIHVTLRFLGEISPELLQDIENAMKEVPIQSFQMELKGLGCFPSPSRINVIWIGIEKGAQKLGAFFNQLEPQFRKLGVKPDNKGFSPHLTIARVKTGRNKERLRQFLDEMRDYEVGNMTVNSIRLKRSVLKPSGPEYSTIFEVKA